MMTVSYRQYKPYTVLALLLLAIGGVLWYGVRPLQESLDRKMRAIQEFHAARENRERQVNRLPELEAQYDAIVENEETLDVLIREDEVVDFVKILENVAREAGVTMSIASKDGGKIIEAKKAAPPALPPAESGKSAEPQPAAEKKPVSGKGMEILETLPYDRYLSLSVKVEGSYEKIVAFVGKLETLPFGLDIIGMDMKKNETPEDSAAQPKRATANPFAILGDSAARPLSEKTEPSAERGALEAVFDVLVYVKKSDL